MFEKIYCIQFLDSPQRRKFMSKQFKDYNLNVEFINAIDFKKLAFFKIIKKKRMPSFFHKILGCALSHYTCVKSAKSLGYKNVLILEDDICFLKNKNVFNSYLNNLPKDWDIIRFAFTTDYNENYLNHYELFNSIKTNDKYIKINNLFSDTFRTNNAGSYALNEKAIDFYLESFENSGLIEADTMKYIFNNFNSSPFKTYTSKIGLMYQQICFPKTSNNTKPYFVKFAAPLHNINPNDFNTPKEFLKSTIAGNVR